MRPSLTYEFEGGYKSPCKKSLHIHHDAIREEHIRKTPTHASYPHRPPTHFYSWTTSKTDHVTLSIQFIIFSLSPSSPLQNGNKHLNPNFKKRPRVTEVGSRFLGRISTLFIPSSPSPCLYPLILALIRRGGLLLPSYHRCCLAFPFVLTKPLPRSSFANMGTNVYILPSLLSPS